MSAKNVASPKITVPEGWPEKTPIASIKLYLETLKTRPVDEEKKQEFYDVMLADTDRLLHTVEQVLSAGRSGEKKRQMNVEKLDLGAVLQQFTNHRIDQCTFASSGRTSYTDHICLVPGSKCLQKTFITLLAILNK